MTRKSLFIQLTFLLYIILALHISALYFFWYWSIWWFDILMHILGGVWVSGMTLWWYLFSYNKGEKRSSYAMYLIPFTSVLIIGVLWEFFEFGLDTFITIQNNDVVDTLSDIGSDISGGFLAVLYILRKTYGCGE